MTNMKLAVTGAAGRMGRALTVAINEAEGCTLVGGTEPQGSEFIGQDMGELSGLGELGAIITDDLPELFTKINGIIDFSTPASTLEHAELAAQARIVHVIGTTGMSKEDEKKLHAASRHSRIIKAGNMSLGVNLLSELVRRVAAALDEDFDIEVVEMHHKHKVDAPSGTALMLGEAAADGRGVNLNDKAVRSRDGITGARKSGDIGFATLRGGSVVGEHTVIFAGNAERIELTHRTQSRTIFANGAIKAALWGADKKPGYYSMLDVLGLNN